MQPDGDNSIIDGNNPEDVNDDNINSEDNHEQYLNDDSSNDDDNTNDANNNNDFETNMENNADSEHSDNEELPYSRRLLSIVDPSTNEDIQSQLPEGVIENIRNLIGNDVNNYMRNNPSQSDGFRFDVV